MKAVAPGTATISVKADGVTLKCKVTVKKAPATTPSTEPDPDDWFTVITPSPEPTTEPQTPSTEPTTEPSTEPPASAGDTPTTGSGAAELPYEFTLRWDKLQIKGGDKDRVVLFTDAPMSALSYKVENKDGEISVDSFSEVPAEESYLGGRYVSAHFIAMREGTSIVRLYYNNTEVASATITITSDYTDYYTYMSWKETWKAQNWTSSMDAREKLRVAGQWVLDNLDYNTHNSSQYLFAQGIGGTCIASAGFIIDLAHDLGLEADYYNYQSEWHVAAGVKIDGWWVAIEAGFNGTAGNRGTCGFTYCDWNETK